MLFTIFFGFFLIPISSKFMKCSNITKAGVALLFELKDWTLISLWVAASSTDPDANAAKICPGEQQQAPGAAGARSGTSLSCCPPSPLLHHLRCLPHLLPALHTCSSAHELTLHLVSLKEKGKIHKLIPFPSKSCFLNITATLRAPLHFLSLPVWNFVSCRYENALKTFFYPWNQF